MEAETNSMEVFHPIIFANIGENLRRDSHRNSSKILENNLFDLSYNLELEQCKLDLISGKNIFLLMGLTNSGKTTTTCFLAGEQLHVTFKKTVHDGEECIGTEKLLDTSGTFRDFKIGHSYDSTTKGLNVCEIFEHEELLVDSCGFEDTEGIIVNLANAVNLKYAISVCSSCRPVFLIDVRNLKTGKGLEFVKLLNLIIRFFRPIELFLPCMSFLFTHAQRTQSEKHVMSDMIELMKADHVKSNPEVKAVIDYISNYIKVNGETVLLSIDRLTAMEASQVRRDICAMIQKAQAITSTTSLGCPISSEDQAVIGEQCQKMRLEIVSNLDNAPGRRVAFGALSEKLHCLQVVGKKIGLDFISEHYEAAKSSICSFLQNLLSSTRTTLSDSFPNGEFERLNDRLKCLQEAAELKAYFDVTGDFNEIIKVLNGKIVELANVILAKDFLVLDDLRRFDYLRVICSELSDFIFTKNGDIYTTTVEEISQRLERIRVSTSNQFTYFNDILKKKSDVIAVVGLSDFCETLTVSMNQLRSCTSFGSHLSKLLVSSYSDFQIQLTSKFNDIHDSFFGTFGYVNVLTQNNAKEEHFASVSFMFSLLCACFDAKMLSHIDSPPLVNLKNVVVEHLKTVTMVHFNSIDTNLVQTAFREMHAPLRTLKGLNISDASFTQSLAESLAHKLDVIRETFDIQFEKLSSLLSLQNDVPVNYKEVLRVITVIKEGECLDSLLVEFNTQSSAFRLNRIVSSINVDWESKINRMLSLIKAKNYFQLQEVYIDLDNMLSVADLIPQSTQGNKQVCDALVKSIDGFLLQIDESTFPQSSTEVLYSYLQECDSWLLFLQTALKTSFFIFFCQYSTEQISMYISNLEIMKNKVLSYVIEYIKGAKDKARSAFAARDSESIKSVLDKLASFRQIDRYVNASLPYEDVKSYLSLELTTAKNATESALARGNVEKAAEYRKFFMESATYALHFPDLDIIDISSGISVKHREATEQIPEQMISMIELKNYNLIKRKLCSLKNDLNKDIFDECDEFLSNHLRSKSAEVLGCESLDDNEAIGKLFSSLEMASEAIVLTGLLTYDPKNLLQLITDTCDTVYQRLEGSIRKQLQAYRFLSASKNFDLLKNFKKFDLLLLKFRTGSESNGGITEGQTRVSFFARIDSLIKTLNNLVSTLKQDCENYLGDEFNDIKLGSLVRNVLEATIAEQVPFREELEINAISDALYGMLKTNFDQLDLQIRDAIGNNQSAVAEKLLYKYERAQEVVATFLHFYGHLTKVKSNFESLNKSFQALVNDKVVERFSFKIACEGQVEILADRLVKQRKLNYDDYSRAKDILSNAFQNEAQLFLSNITSETFTREKMFDIFGFVKGLLLYRLKVGFDERPKDTHLSRECFSRLRTFLETECSNLQRKIKAMNDIRGVYEWLSILTNGIEDLLSFETKELNKVAADLQILSDVNISFELLRKDVTSANSLLDDAENFIAGINLYVSLDDTVTEKLSLLEKQSYSQHNTQLEDLLSNILSQFSYVPLRIQEACARKDYKTIADVLYNLSMLEGFTFLKAECAKSKNDAETGVQTHRKLLGDHANAFFDSSDFQNLELVVVDISNLDSALQSKVHSNQEPYQPLIEVVKNRFLTHMEQMVKSSNLCTTEDHAKVICDLKRIVKDISNRQIQEIADQQIRSYLEHLSKNKIDFFQLGVKLSELGVLGEEVIASYSQFTSVLTRRFNELSANITINHALTAFATLNPLVRSESIERLRFLISEFEKISERLLTEYLPGYKSLSCKKLSCLVDEVTFKARGLKEPYDAQKIIEILAGIFAVWTIHMSEKMFNESKDKLCLMRPHNVQLISILCMLNLDKVDGMLTKILSYLKLIDSSDEYIDGHLVQVGTGEGKSILLGGLSTLLTLLGFEVSCASYSKHLSNRDYEAFFPLFDLFKVSALVKYSTLDGLIESVINSKGDVRALVESKIFGTNTSSIGPNTAQKSSRNVERILLVDEVDVFFSYFGKCYTPIAKYHSAETIGIMRYIWSLRTSPINMTDIAALPMYSALIANCHLESKVLIDLHLQYMLKDVNNFNDPPYVVVNVQTASGVVKKIGYKDLDRVATNKYYGYRTAFAYLHESQNYSNIKCDDELALQLPSGEFSYAAIPLKYFRCILGVTGTLSCLCDAEKAVIDEHYKVNKMTLSPSIYGDSQLDFKQNDLVVLPDKDRYYQMITMEIQKAHGACRPCIVFFETEELLNEYSASEYGQRLPEKFEVTEKTENIGFYVNKATVTGTITLFPKVFGRGLDFVSRDRMVDDAGGVLVIQTFFSDSLSEEIQIKGRTARQAKKGAYKMILLASDLEKFNMSKADIDQANSTPDFYKNLNNLRTDQVAQRVIALRDKAAVVKEKHMKSLDLINMLLDPHVQSKSVFDTLMSLQGASVPAFHVIFCLDESGSMESYWSALLDSYKAFLRIRLDQGGHEDVVSVIQFNSLARITVKGRAILEALNTAQQLKNASGGTCFIPPLQKANEIIAEDSSGLNIVMVFMTDGECTESPRDIQAVVYPLFEEYLSKRNLKFFGVYFGAKFSTDGQKLQNLTGLMHGTTVEAKSVGDLTNSFQSIARSVSAGFSRDI